MTAPRAPQTRGALGAGFRYSVYGPDCVPPAEYWGLVGLEMARRFEGAVPETIWIVGRLHRPGTRLSFPVDAKDSLIAGTPHDENEAMLTLFDRLGFRVWLQVEPGFASVEELIDLVMTRYKHHPSVIGFGIDVVWSDAVKSEGTSRVTWEIEQVGDSCRLTVTHDQLNEGANAELYGGWMMILSGLKTLLETGQLLTTPGSLMYVGQDSNW